MMKKPSLSAFAILALSLLAAQAEANPNAAASNDNGEKVLHLPMRSAGPGSLDPILGSTTYDNRACSSLYETLLQYKYLKRPYELEPLLLAEMPTSPDAITWTFKLKSGVRFHDDPCFPGGQGRELVTDDVFYSLKRHANPRYTFKNWWLLEDTIVGFDDYKASQGAAVELGEKFNYDVNVKGLEKIDDQNFRIVLTDPISRFLWILPMFQMSIVPREAVDMYGTKFARHPVGTGPFLLKEGDWIENKSMVLTRNPNYHPSTYPTEWEAADEELGLHLAAGKKLPFVDRVEITMFVQENPMWLEFNAQKLDYTQVPDENYKEAFHKRSRKLKRAYRERGIVDHQIPLLDFIFRAFNMDDELVGGYTPKKRALRQAISLATNLYEFNDTFYSGNNIIYDGMIPPGLAGYPEGGFSKTSFLGPDLARAKDLLAQAGYPGGDGLPVIDYYVSRSGNIPEQAELFKRQLAEINVRLNVRILNFPQLIEAVNKKKAALFSFAWSSDYPDGENNLAIFYGPNESPGSNHFNYKVPEFDRMYEKIRSMQNGPERTALMEKMRDSVTRDTPFVGSMARTRFYLVNPRLKNFKPEETFYNWTKYLDVDDSVGN